MVSRLSLILFYVGLNCRVLENVRFCANICLKTVDAMQLHFVAILLFYDLQCGFEKLHAYLENGT